MGKEQEQKPDNDLDSSIENENLGSAEDKDKIEEEHLEVTLEKKIEELEDRLARSFAEMENQRRRFEKEKDEAFDYGGFAFAKEALNLIDNLERSKQILENDEKLKETEALKKTIEHLNIINKDLISIFAKNNIQPIDSLNKKTDKKSEENQSKTTKK